MKTHCRTGASRLHLNNHELRRELQRADRIIANATKMLSLPQEEMLYRLNEVAGITSADDPLAENARLRAMHRITPKRDYSKVIIIALALLCGMAWFASQTENELLRAELAQLQAK